MTAQRASGLQPGQFCRLLLQTLEAAEGRRRRRKRDQTPDAIGLALKRDLLERAVADDPPPEAFEAWLLGAAIAAPASGPVRAMCAEIFHEYRFAAADPHFHGWLEAGAPSADADPASVGAGPTDSRAVSSAAGLGPQRTVPNDGSPT